MSGEEINFEEFGAQGAADLMGDAVNAIRTTINQVTEAAGAVKRGWQGDANLAFDRSCGVWEDEADRLKSILDQITMQVGEGNKSYKEMEADNTDFFANSAGNHSSAVSPNLTNLSV